LRSTRLSGERIRTVRQAPILLAHNIRILAYAWYDVIFVAVRAVFAIKCCCAMLNRLTAAVYRDFLTECGKIEYPRAIAAAQM